MTDRKIITERQFVSLEFSYADAPNWEQLPDAPKHTDLEFESLLAYHNQQNEMFKARIKELETPPKCRVCGKEAIVKWLTSCSCLDDEIDEATGKVARLEARIKELEEKCNPVVLRLYSECKAEKERLKERIKELEAELSDIHADHICKEAKR